MNKNIIENAPVVERKNKRAAVPQIWTVLNRARKTFDAQIEKSNEVKLACLKKFARAANDDQQKFYNDFMQQVGRLTDSVRFNEAAKANDCDPKILASHIVFLGSAMVNKVLKLGLENAGVLEDIDLYREAFMSADAQEFAK